MQIVLTGSLSMLAQLSLSLVQLSPSLFLNICYILNFATKCGSHHQNPTARSKSYWVLGAQVPTQFPRLVLAPGSVHA